MVFTPSFHVRKGASAPFFIGKKNYTVVGVVTVDAVNDDDGIVASNGLCWFDSNKRHNGTNVGVR
jgi:hypothetical protein